MKNLVRVTCFVFALVLFSNLFTSCKKDEVVDPAPEVTTPTTPSEVTPSDNVMQAMSLVSGGGMNTDSADYCDCFAIFDDVDWDASDDDIIAQLEIILAGLTDEEIEELFTPVCTFDGEIFENACVAICNGVTEFEECEDFDGENDWNECFSFEYPMTVVLPGGTNIEVNNDDELITVIDDWYDANPDSDEDPTLIYPVNVLLESDNSTVTINNDDELEDLFDVCSEDHEDECFTFNWPLSIQFPDGSVVEINNFDEAEDLVDAWYDANPDVNEDVELVYPFDVTLEDGTVQTINSEEEFDTFIEEECDGDWDGGCLVQDTSNALVQGVQKMKN